MPNIGVTWPSSESTAKAAHARQRAGGDEGDALHAADRDADELRGDAPVGAGAPGEAAAAGAQPAREAERRRHGERRQHQPVGPHDEGAERPLGLGGERGERVEVARQQVHRELLELHPDGEARRQRDHLAAVGAGHRRAAAQRLGAAFARAGKAQPLDVEADCRRHRDDGERARPTPARRGAGSSQAPA